MEEAWFLLLPRELIADVFERLPLSDLLRHVVLSQQIVRSTAMKNAMSIGCEFLINFFFFFRYYL